MTQEVDPRIVVGKEYVWEPFKPWAAERVRVLEIKNGMVKTEGQGGKLCWNDMDRFAEAVLNPTGPKDAYDLLRECRDKLSAAMMRWHRQPEENVLSWEDADEMIKKIDAAIGGPHDRRSLACVNWARKEAGLPPLP